MTQTLQVLPEIKPVGREGANCHGRCTFTASENLYTIFLNFMFCNTCISIQKKQQKHNNIVEAGVLLSWS
jgi:hypothetical protein